RMAVERPLRRQARHMPELELLIAQAGARQLQSIPGKSQTAEAPMMGLDLSRRRQGWKRPETHLAVHASGRNQVPLAVEGDTSHRGMAVVKLAPAGQNRPFHQSGDVEHMGGAANREIAP